MAASATIDFTITMHEGTRAKIEDLMSVLHRAKQFGERVEVLIDHERELVELRVLPAEEEPL